MTTPVDSHPRWRIILSFVLLLATSCLVYLVATNRSTENAYTPRGRFYEDFLSNELKELQEQYKDILSDAPQVSQEHKKLPQEHKILPLDHKRKLEREGTNIDDIARKNNGKENSKKPFENPRPTTPDMNVPVPTFSPGEGASGDNVPKIIPYKPGLINKQENGLSLSEGLVSRIIAKTGKKVTYHNGEQSDSKFHTWPDGGDVFADTRAENPGGWIYLSNSEEDITGQGGVGALTFDAQGNLIDYRMVLTGTTMNCNGGRTHFGAWITCEEDFWDRAGKAWQVDPLGIREPKPIAMSLGGGIFEAFAEDVRDMINPKFFLTEDDYYGALRRWQPINPDWSNPWEVLLGEGKTDYLMLIPNQNNHTEGIFAWVEKKQQAQRNAGLFYPNSEGIAVFENILYFVCKRFSHLFVLDLDKMSYTRHSTLSDTFDGSPDGVRQFITNTEDGGEKAMLYFTEDGGNKAGIHAQNGNGEIIEILNGDYEPETTGLSFTPDGKRMYFAFQEEGIVFEVKREDGEPFHAKTLNVKQHQYEAGDSVVSTGERRRRSRDRRER